MTTVKVKRVAVVGAGVGGVSAAVYLQRAGLDVTVYERNARAGGIWVYDERVPRDAAYPSTFPSTGDSLEFEAWHCGLGQRQDSPVREYQRERDVLERREDDLSVDFAPPGPCYITLRNNVSTIEMEMACQAWKTGTEEFVLHNTLAEYIQDAAIANGAIDLISFDTRVTQIQKKGNKWRVEIARLQTRNSGQSVTDSTEYFDAVVIATGHYHACYVPDIPGLARLKQRYPNNVRHSKLYRRPEEFRDQNVLLIGSGVSSMDIARNLEGMAKSVYQSSRGGLYDVPSNLLPLNAARVGGIERFEVDGMEGSGEEGAVSITVHLAGQKRLCNINQVIVCTGYHVSFPFMRQCHQDGVRPEDANETVLVTDGVMTHNLHKDIWYIPDCTLAFIGVPYHSATFTLFEFQAMALAAVFAGRVTLPSTANMRKEYLEKVEEKGIGRTFHSLRRPGAEIAYVEDLVGMVNVEGNSTKMVGHTQKWLEAYERRRERMTKLFSAVRDPSLDLKVIAAMSGC